MPGQRIGSLIGAAFGLVYVVVNSGRMSTVACWGVRALALVLFLAAVGLVLTGRDPTSREDGDGAGTRGPAPFGRGYWVIVLLEVVAIVIGVRLVAGPLDHPHAGVAWVSVVVGTHFFALAAHFDLPFFHVLGALVTGCGATALVLAFATGSELAVATVGGVLPGFVLLGFALRGMTRTVGVPREQPARTRS